jgi:hypothetical protein
LNPEHASDIVYGEKPKTGGRSAGLFTMHTGKKNTGHVIRADEVHLTGNFAELRSAAPLPDERVDERLPGDVS